VLKDLSRIYLGTKGSSWGTAIKSGLCHVGYIRIDFGELTFVSISVNWHSYRFRWKDTYGALPLPVSGLMCCECVAMNKTRSQKWIQCVDWFVVCIEHVTNTTLGQSKVLLDQGFCVILCSLHGYHCGCYTFFSWASKILWIEPAPFTLCVSFTQPAFIFCKSEHQLYSTEVIIMQYTGSRIPALNTHLKLL
jgi:hypothetical protein